MDEFKFANDETYRYRQGLSSLLQNRSNLGEHLASFSHVMPNTRVKLLSNNGCHRIQYDQSGVMNNYVFLQSLQPSS